MKSVAGNLVLIGLATVIVAAMAAAPGSHRQDRVDWADRLESLTPDDAMAYFILAEEIADAATDEAARELSRQLFRLAGTLDRERLGRSACLALADLEEDPREKRYLLALAGLLDRQSVNPLWFNATESTDGREKELALSEAFSYYRRGLGNRALQLLERHDAIGLLAENEHVIGDPDRFLQNCRTYTRGDVSPVKSNRELMDLLQLELALLTGSERTWSTDLFVSRGDPLIEVDPTNLDTALRVDTTRAYYRGGRWVRNP